MNLLRASRVFVFEPPPGVKANLLRTFSAVPAPRMCKVSTRKQSKGHRSLSFTILPNPNHSCSFMAYYHLFTVRLQGKECTRKQNKAIEKFPLSLSKVNSLSNWHLLCHDLVSVIETICNSDS